MNLTQEQQEIINSSGNIKINAVAGSGKTTTIIEYARTRPEKSKILYLVFNKSVKLEAVGKFAKKGLKHVRVETAHSLAYKQVVLKNGYKVRAQGYKTSEIAELLKLEGNGEKHTEYIVANHINKLIICFCNSDKQKIEDLNYLDTISDAKSKGFVATFYKYIEKKAALLLDKMDRGEIEITHDFYLKKFQLSNPQLNYDYILFDECQDASASILDVFLKQKAVKVIVGDSNQQIYGWRYAINSLEKVDFKTYRLSTSFRFGTEIASLAVEILNYKKHIERDSPVKITGSGNCKNSKTKAVLARTNLGLLVSAIEHVTQKESVKHIYFEGNINSYTYADEGASLYDVLNLSNKKYSQIRDKLIRSMKDLRDLEDYIKKTEDPQLGMLVEIVKKYGNRIHSIMKTIKEKHVSNEEKQKAEIVFSTVHRSKGMEYDAVTLVDDFITEKTLLNFREGKNQHYSPDKLNEEINLLYVAVTRAKHSVYIPEKLLPKNFPGSPNIQIIKPEEKEGDSQSSPAEKEISTEEKETPRQKTYVLDDVRKEFKEAYQPWTEDADNELRQILREGLNTRQIAGHFGRTTGAVRSRVKKLGL